MKKHYYVYTHLGRFETWAVSAEKAIANIRFRLFGGRTGAQTAYWEVKKA